MLFTKQRRDKRKVKKSKQKLVRRRKRLKRTKAKDIKRWFGTKKKRYKIKNFCFFLSIIRMSEKTLKFDNIGVNKKKFNKSKQTIDLDLLNADQIVVSEKFKHSDDGFKYFIGYKEGEIVKPLCIILPQMTGYIKYFENGGKNVSFVIKDDNVR